MSIYMRPPVRKYAVNGDIDSTAEKSRVRRRLPPLGAREAVPRRSRDPLAIRRFFCVIVADVDVVVVSSSPLTRSLSNYRGDDVDEKGWRARGEEGVTCGTRRRGGNE